MWGCKQQARNADEWRKCWDLTADDDSLSLLTRCRVPVVHELLWLTVGWSRLANRAVRLEQNCVKCPATYWHVIASLESVVFNNNNNNNYHSTVLLNSIVLSICSTSLFSSSDWATYLGLCIDDVDGTSVTVDHCSNKTAYQINIIGYTRWLYNVRLFGPTTQPLLTASVSLQRQSAYGEQYICTVYMSTKRHITYEFSNHAT